MTKLPSSPSITLSFLALFLILPLKTHAFGSGSTLAVTSDSPTVCGVVAAQSKQSIMCFKGGQIVNVLPNISFSSISGGDSFFCGIRSGGYAFLCWNTVNQSNSPAIYTPQRVYYNTTVLLQNIAVGGDQVCGTLNDTANENGTGGGGSVKCWRGEYNNSTQSPVGSDRFISISSGYGFSCGILMNNSRIRCWGRNPLAAEIESQFGDMLMFSIVAGGSHVCGMNSTGFLVCKGENFSGQLDIPMNSAALMYTPQLSLGANHSCAIRVNGSVVCWGGSGGGGGGGGYGVNGILGVSFESIVSGSNFTCGLTTINFSVICWGSGWPNLDDSGVQIVPFSDKVLPGSCVQSVCEFGVYPDSQSLCSGLGHVCNPPSFNLSMLLPPAAPPPEAAEAQPRSPSKELTTGLLVFCIIGSVGGLAGICTVIYCLWTGVCFGKKKVHNSVQPTITRAGSNGGTTSNNSGLILSRSSTIRRQSSRAMRRQRSGTSSKHADRAEEFSLSELAAATNNFALENKIGAGSFGIVYRAKLLDGREVAIKRGETGQKTKKFQEKESAFDSELAFLSRLHHKHLVRLVGYCEDGDERLLVYEFMKNGALYDHLHDKNNTGKTSSVVNSWKMRIKIALDAARGIEYLHSYAVPPIIHRDIKSSNILLDANWTARVSDFGLSLLGPEADRDYRPMKAAGTVGYIDPEYYGLNVLTAKSDVYGLGVVLLELLTGKRAIFKDSENGSTPTSIVDYAVPKILAGELGKFLDPRVGAAELNEAEAVELVAYTALHCVNLEGKDRPTMSDIVANLERALSLCHGSHGSISSGTISLVSE
ncbi:putative serine/threonine-protein kinase-like protein CCR3 [Euphorbia lathyris]|uniref:putative serine/threonine-protein kinase-like protein CCR3 n=1 Tax=Euphorbia lathyris TaxID=212925 RepID=UPI003313C90A